MLLEHRGRRPVIEPHGVLEPTALVCGEVRGRRRPNPVRRLAKNSVVPIGWVAVGDSAAVLPPGRHHDIWAVQEQLHFPGTVYGTSRGTTANERLRAQRGWYAAHGDDRAVPEDDRGR
jgi:hypothetical protein